MKPVYEHITIGAGCSVRVFHRKLARIPFEWHRHPEYELTLTMNSCGKRYIGDAIATYGHDDLVLVPPDLPHTWASNRSIERGAPQTAVVIWFEGDWVRRLASCCPEYEPLRGLLRRSGCGLAFGAHAGAMVRAWLPGLLSDAPRTRLHAALEVLCALAQEDGEPLASPSAFAGGATGLPSGYQPERFNRVLALIDARFAEAWTLAALAAAATMSVRSLNRHFRQHVGESVGQYLARVRIGHACRLLSDTTLAIAAVAAQSGFGSLAHFGRQFRALKGMTPSQYRSEFSGATPVAAGAADLEARPPSLDAAARSKRGRTGKAVRTAS